MLLRGVLHHVVQAPRVALVVGGGAVGSALPDAAGTHVIRARLEGGVLAGGVGAKGDGLVARRGERDDVRDARVAGQRFVVTHPDRVAERCDGARAGGAVGIAVSVHHLMDHFRPRRGPIRGRPRRPEIVPVERSRAGRSRRLEPSDADDPRREPIARVHQAGPDGAAARRRQQWRVDPRGHTHAAVLSSRRQSGLARPLTMRQARANQAVREANP
jgi:hypothetical protein